MRFVSHRHPTKFTARYRVDNNKGSLTINKSLWWDGSNIFGHKFNFVAGSSIEFTVACQLPSGSTITEVLKMTKSNNFQITTSHFPVNSICHIEETPFPAPGNGKLAIHYLGGQDFTILPGNKNIIVHNEQHFRQGSPAALQLHIIKLLRGANWTDFDNTTFDINVTCTNTSNTQIFPIHMSQDNHFSGGWMGSFDSCSIDEPGLPSLPAPLVSKNCQWGTTEYQQGSSIPNLSDLHHSLGALATGNSVVFSNSTQNINYYLVVTNVVDCP